MGTVLRGGTVVSGGEYRADVRIDGPAIAAIGQGIAQSGDRIIEVDGCYLLPGGIDPHTHFDLDVGTTVTADDFASGTKAALAGGTTTIIDFATQAKGGTLQAALSAWQAKAAAKCFTDYGFHMAITDFNDRIACEMGELVAQGVTSFKLYMAYKHNLQVDDSVIFRTLRHSRGIGALIGFHCENGDVIDTLVQEAIKAGQTSPRYHALTRPAAAEAEATHRVISLAEMAGAPLYIVHLSCAGAMDAVLAAKARGVRVYAETCPQYLLLDDACYEAAGFEAAKYVMSPPLRTKQDQGALWNSLRTGLLDTVATDHCSFNFHGQKELGQHDFSKIPNGGPGVEHRLALLYTYGVLPGRITLQQLVDYTATNAAKLFGLFPRKGIIAPGSDADIVVWNPNHSATISAASQTQRVDYTPYEGWHQQGQAEYVFLRGCLAAQSGKPCGEPRGEYLRRNPFPDRRENDG
jgi:dihydropyrimidinase